MKVLLILLFLRGTTSQNLRSSGIKEDTLPRRSIFNQEHLEVLSKEIKVLQEKNDHAAAAELTDTYRSRKLIKDADRKNTCFQDKGKYLAEADYLLNPFLANNDRGDWGKCLPEELFGIMCEHEVPHMLNDKDPISWKEGDGPLHDQLSEQLFLEMKSLHDETCVHVDLDISDEVQDQFNDFLHARNKYAHKPIMGDGDITDVVFLVEVTDGKYYLNGVKSPMLTMIAGVKYTFLTPDLEDHPFKIDFEIEGHAMPTLDGVTYGNKKVIVQLPTDVTVTNMVYKCELHPGMGNMINVIARPPTTYNVTNVGTKYYLNGQTNPKIALNRGETYKFDVSQISMTEHPFRIGTRHGQTNIHNPHNMGFEEAVTLSDKGYYVKHNIEATQFNEDFKACPVVQYTRNGRVHSVYMRTSPIPNKFDAYTLFTDTWSDADNKLNTDFEIYDDKDDLLEGENKWMFCNFNDKGVGYPRDCGKTKKVNNQWFSLPEGRFEARGLIRGASFHIHSAAGCPSVLGPEVLYGNYNYNNNDNVVTVVVPMDAPHMLTYYCTNHSGMGNSIIVPAMTTMSHRRLQEYKETDHGHDMKITYDMACVQKYPNNPRFAMQMSLYCMTAFFSHGDVSTALFDSPYEISSSCDIMMRMHKRTLDPSPVYTPSAFCDQDVENDTCTVRAYVKPYIGKTCKSYCESFPGLHCVSAHVINDRGEGEQCLAGREMNCDAEQPGIHHVAEHMLCTCSTADKKIVEEEEDAPTSSATKNWTPQSDLNIVEEEEDALTPSATKLLVQPQSDLLLCHQDFRQDIVKVFTSKTQTCNTFCKSAGLMCIRGVRSEPSSCITKYEYAINECEQRENDQMCTCAPISRYHGLNYKRSLGRSTEITGSLTDLVVLSGWYREITNVGIVRFNSAFKACPVVQYTRNGSVLAVYTRISPIPNDFNAYELFTNTWADKNNKLNVDFELYDNIDNLNNPEQKWMWCNYDDNGVGFPRDCGKTGGVSNRWFTMPGGRFSPRFKEGASFAVHSSNGCPSKHGDELNIAENNTFRAKNDFTTLVEIGDETYFVEKNVGKDEFNRGFKACPVVQYTRNGSVLAVYKRRTTIPDDFNAYDLFTHTWADKNNKLNVDFELYDNIDNLNNSEQKWEWCNYNDNDVGFPRDCGKTGRQNGRWFTMPGGDHSPRSKQGASFAVHNSVECPSPSNALVTRHDTTAINNIACKRMAMQPNNGIKSYYGADSITRNPHSCTVESDTDSYKGEHTCNKFCSTFQYMTCVGAHSNADAVFQDGTLDHCDTLNYDQSAACQCALDKIYLDRENERVAEPTSNACINLAFSGDFSSHEIYEYCDSNQDPDTCTVNINAKQREITCSEFCSSHQDMVCVSASGIKSLSERRQCKSDKTPTYCDISMMHEYLQCECGFVPHSDRAIVLKRGPVLVKNTQDYCSAYTPNHANESDRRYQKVTLTLGVHSDTDSDGSIPVVAAKMAHDHSDTNLDSYNTQDVEVCEGLEFITPTDDDPSEMCSFGHRSDSYSNCYGKLEMSFNKASEKCAARNGHLLRLDNEDEFNKLSKIFRRQSFSIGLHSDNTFAGMEWDGYPGCKVDFEEDLNYLTIKPKRLTHDCWELNLKDKTLSPHLCTDTKTWICEAYRPTDPYRPTETPTDKYNCESDNGLTGVGGDLKKDEGGFCIFYLENPKLSLPDDESGGFRNTEIAHFLAFSEETRTRKYYKEYGELVGAEFRGHYENDGNWAKLTRNNIGLTSNDTIVNIDHETDDFHCHFSPTNFGISRIYLQQHMLERIYPGAFKKHCFCGYKHLGKLVSRCDCTKNGVKNSNCQKEHRPMLYKSTYKENGEYVYCNNGQCDQPSP